MATTIPASFTIFRSNNEITDLQISTISTRQQNVRTAVEKDYEVLKSFLTGSYKRSTLISPLTEADIDIFVVLSVDHYKSDGAASVLDGIRRTLLKTYTKSPKISRNGQAVTITFTDFIVDVVPAFNRKGGGFLIPDSKNNAWISTDPTVHETYLSTANAAHNGDLVPVIKMIKRWNREIGRSFRTFYLELVAVDIFNNVTLSSDSSAVRYFFDKGRSKIGFKSIDPAGFGNQVDPLDNCSSVENAKSRFETAYNRAINAEAYEKSGKNQLAVEEWRKIFGDRFPAYG